MNEMFAKRDMEQECIHCPRIFAPIEILREREKKIYEHSPIIPALLSNYVCLSKECRGVFVWIFVYVLCYSSRKTAICSNTK